MSDDELQDDSFRFGLIFWIAHHLASPDYPKVHTHSYSRQARKLAGHSITQHSRDPVDQASNENIRNQGGDLGYDQGFAEVDPLQFDELVDDIDCKSSEENLSYRLPALSQPMPAMLRFCYQRPSVRRSLLPQILKAIAYGKYCGHDRLDDQPNFHRPVDAIE